MLGLASDKQPCSQKVGALQFSRSKRKTLSEEALGLTCTHSPMTLHYSLRKFGFQKWSSVFTALCRLQQWTGSREALVFLFL